MENGQRNLLQVVIITLALIPRWAQIKQNQKRCENEIEIDRGLTVRASLTVIGELWKRSIEMAQSLLQSPLSRSPTRRHVFLVRSVVNHWRSSSFRSAELGLVGIVRSTSDGSPVATSQWRWWRRRIGTEQISVSDVETNAASFRGYRSNEIFIGVG